MAIADCNHGHPAILYAYLIFGQEFPEMKNLASNTASNLKNMATPLFIFMALCMSLTATTELGTQQWVERILSEAGASPMLVLAPYHRADGGRTLLCRPVIHRLNPTGVLWISAIVATVGIYLMSSATGGMVYVAAVLFAIGVMYFWPTMIGIHC